jgi:hypothetical protein
MLLSLGRDAFIIRRIISVVISANARSLVLGIVLAVPNPHPADAAILEAAIGPGCQVWF